MYFSWKASKDCFPFEVLTQHYLNFCGRGGPIVPGTCTEKRNVKSEKALEAES